VDPGILSEQFFVKVKLWLPKFKKERKKERKKGRKKERKKMMK